MKGNEIFAIHIDGKIMPRRMFGYTFARIFTQKGHAKVSLSYLPEKYRKMMGSRIEIVRYLPELINTQESE